MLSTLLLLVTLTPPSPQAPVAQMLDNWHQAAARADESAYFALFTPDAVFMGTDMTERWTRDEFQRWAHPIFAKGKAWAFKARVRRVTFSADGHVAWFDEELETEKLGPCRGSGVAVLQDGHWRLAQYNLSTPIPNPVFADVRKIIAAELAKPTKKPR